MVIKVSPHYISKEKELLHFIKNFDSLGEYLVKGKRNKIKLFDLDGEIINVKSFKKPNLVNKLVYRFFRKSKAQRSFEFANILLEKGIGTPQPIAYMENKGFFSFKDSYYISEQLQPDLTFRELIEVPDYPDHENILRQFTRFTFQLHEKGIEFLDHTPGNTLIKKTGEGIYAFYLVDLNRMQFHDTMGFEQRIINMAKLTPKKHLVEVMSEEYAKLYGRTYEEVLGLLAKHAHYFNNKFHRKRRLKKKLKFWKK